MQERYLQHEPVLAGAPSTAYRARKFIRRHRIGVTFAVLVIFLLAGFAVSRTIQAARIARERDTAEQVSEFLVGLFEVSDPSEARGTTITAREVLDKGVEYRGKVWPSLSAVAREITGARWSGPRFFGLKGATDGRG